MNCTICGGILESYASARILGRYPVSYFRCAGCGFLKTEEPFWLEEAYSEAINAADVGMVQRNQRIAKVTRALITLLFDGSRRFVDYGGGYGLFVRMMRDAGYDFYRYDKHCRNIFAADFEADLHPGEKFELLTAFELFEHLADPVAEVRGMLEFSDSVFFTTEIVPEGNPSPDSWSYFGLEHGQHISFYTLRSLELLGQQFGLRLYSDGVFRHLLTPKRVSPWLFRIVSIYKIGLMAGPFTARKSLTPQDYQRVTGRSLK